MTHYSGGLAQPRLDYMYVGSTWFSNVLLQKVFHRLRIDSLLWNQLDCDSRCNSSRLIDKHTYYTILTYSIIEQSIAIENCKHI